MTIGDGLILNGEALIIPPLKREKILHAIHKGHMGITIRKMVEACPTCQCHCPQEPRQPLQSSPASECPWQHIGADFFTFDGFEYLVIIDYYTKMSFIRKIPPSQCNAAKTISEFKELFSEHGIPETIRSDNGPQFASHQFAEFTKEWNFGHTTSSPRNPRSNGQAEAAIKVATGLITCAKYSEQDLYLALLTYRSTPIDAHLHSLTEMLYQRVIRTTVPQRIRHKDPKLQLTEITSMTVPPRVLHTMTFTASPSPHYMLDKLSLYSMMPRLSGFQPQSSAKLDMAYTWFKSLGEASTDVHETTSVNVIQMLISQTCWLALI